MNNPILTARVCRSNAEQFRDILNMYVPDGSVVADVTWGRGRFWKGVSDSGRYLIVASDISHGEVPNERTFLRANFEFLPYRDGTFDAMIFDPPYGNGSTRPRTDGISDTYNLPSRRTPRDIFGQYEAFLTYSTDCLKPGGIAIVKCQDMVNNGAQHFHHCEVYLEAVNLQFVCEDLFVMVQGRNPTMRHKHQVHARKNHSFWWVFRKPKRR